MFHRHGFEVESKLSDIKSLKNLTNLRELDLSGHEISESDINELKESLPHCEIRF
jgi:Leucine-rich repeat (LRR) protein